MDGDVSFPSSDDHHLEIAIKVFIIVKCRKNLNTIVFVSCASFGCIATVFVRDSNMSCLNTKECKKCRQSG